MSEGSFTEGYTQTPVKIKIEGVKKPIKTEIDLRKPKGEVLLKNGSRALIAPQSTDFPLSSGVQLQVVDQSIRAQDLREAPLLSDKVDPRSILALIRTGITAERTLVGKTDTAWANLNLHSRPPMSADSPIDAQYDPLTLDIHGRDIKDASNWAMPPPTHAGWGAESTDNIEVEFQKSRQSVDENGKVIAATSEDIERYKHDPGRKVLDQASARVQRREEYEGWRENPEGKYKWDTGRRKYTADELVRLRSVFGTSEFLAETTKLDNIDLFPDPNPPAEHFEPNETDMVLWEFGGFQLVTQKTPLVDADEGMHMVLKLLPESHAPWDNPQQALEAYAIGLGIIRLLKNTRALGDIGDAYLDMNANWSMTRKREELSGKSSDEIKQAIQRDTKTHLHIQLEKMTAAWEIPPAPGTFKENRPQSKEAIEEIKGILNNPDTGLQSWILQNCAGKLPR